MPSLQRTFDLWCSFHLILANTLPLEVLLNDGSLLGDEQTQLDLGGPLECDALLQTYYGFVERDGTSFLSNLNISASRGTQVHFVLSMDGWYRVCSYMCGFYVELDSNRTVFITLSTMATTQLLATSPSMQQLPGVSVVKTRVWPCL